MELMCVSVALKVALASQMDRIERQIPTEQGERYFAPTIWSQNRQLWGWGVAEFPRLIEILLKNFLIEKD